MLFLIISLSSSSICAISNNNFSLIFFRISGSTSSYIFNRSFHLWGLKSVAFKRRSIYPKLVSYISFLVIVSSSTWFLYLGACKSPKILACPVGSAPKIWPHAFLSFANALAAISILSLLLLNAEKLCHGHSNFPKISFGEFDLYSKDKLSRYRSHEYARDAYSLCTRNSSTPHKISI